MQAIYLAFDRYGNPYGYFSSEEKANAFKLDMKTAGMEVTIVKVNNLE